MAKQKFAHKFSGNSVLRLFLLLFYRNTMCTAAESFVSCSNYVSQTSSISELVRLSFHNLTINSDARPLKKRPSEKCTEKRGLFRVDACLLALETSTNKEACLDQHIRAACVAGYGMHYFVCGLGEGLIEDTSWSLAYNRTSTPYNCVFPTKGMLQKLTQCSQARFGPEKRNKNAKLDF